MAEYLGIISYSTWNTLQMIIFNLNLKCSLGNIEDMIQSTDSLHTIIRDMLYSSFAIDEQGGSMKSPSGKGHVRVTPLTESNSQKYYTVLGDRLLLLKLQSSSDFMYNHFQQQYHAVELFYRHSQSEKWVKLNLNLVTKQETFISSENQWKSMLPRNAHGSPIFDKEACLRLDLFQKGVQICIFPRQNPPILGYRKSH